MTEKLFQVILLPHAPDAGIPIENVYQNLAQAFQVDISKIEGLLAKAPTIIKSGIDKTTAELFSDAIMRCGASCEIREQSSSPVPSPRPRSTKTTFPSVTSELPQDKLVEVLRGFQPQAGLHVTPKIPDAKIKNALERCRVHPMETVLALVDCTVFGSAKDCLLVTSGGLYYSNDAQFESPGGAVPFYELARRELSLVGEFAVSLGKGDLLDTSGSPMERDRILALVEAIRSLFTD